MSCVMYIINLIYSTLQQIFYILFDTVATCIRICDLCLYFIMQYITFSPIGKSGGCNKDQRDTSHFNLYIR